VELSLINYNIRPVVPLAWQSRLLTNQNCNGAGRQLDRSLVHRYR